MTPMHNNGNKLSKTPYFTLFIDEFVTIPIMTVTIEKSPKYIMLL